MLLFGALVSPSFTFDSGMFSLGCGVFRVFVRGVSFSLRTIGCVLFFDFLCFFFGEFRRFLGENFCRFPRFFFFSLSFCFVFEFGAADDGIGLCVVLGFFVLGFGEISGQRGDLVFAQFGVNASPSWRGGFTLRRRGFLHLFGNRRRSFGGRGLGCRFGARFRKYPAREPAG